MPEPKITFYDISSLLGLKTWSPNTWKPRLVLNYKQIPYKTVWVALSDVEDAVKKIGGKPTDVKPNKGGGVPMYTLPAILDESGDTPVVVTDSTAIIEYLDAKYPDRPVLPKSGKALEYAFEGFFQSYPEIERSSVNDGSRIQDFRGAHQDLLRTDEVGLVWLQA